MFLCVNPRCQLPVNPLRWTKISRLCMQCGEVRARAQTHCVVPLAKGAYQPITDITLLKGLNKSSNLDVTVWR